MTNPVDHPTPYPAINSLLNDVLTGAQAVLADHFIGMYLDGSLASGDFDEDSDIDFVVVTDVDIAGDLFRALQAMHDRIAALDTPWAIQLEGSYVSLAGLRRHDPAHALHPNIERGTGERLKMTQHGAWWEFHRHILRDCGIVITGPAPQTLIDPVPTERLQDAALATLREGIAPIMENPAQISSRGYQSYIVLSVCRILYTLEHGGVATKPVAARWAQEALGVRWQPLIERAWVGRHHPGVQASADEIGTTLDFIRFALERARGCQRMHNE